MAKHEHQPTIPTRPKSASNLCRCGKVIEYDRFAGEWKGGRA